MRLTVTIDGLSDNDWTFFQNALKTRYEIPENADRVCLVVVHGQLERHVEMTVGALTGLLISMTMRPIRSAFNRFRTAMAALTPDDDRLPTVKNTGDAVATGPGAVANTGVMTGCVHGADVVKEEPSVFQDGGPVRTYRDGCQSYGPYGRESDK